MTLAHGVSSGLRRTVVVAAALVLAAATAAVTSLSASQPAQPQLAVAGVAQDPCQPQRELPVPAQLTGQFEPDSSILRTAGGVYAAPGRPVPLTRAESACVAAAERASRDWLRAGLVPGVTATQRSMATRALLDLRLAVQPDGAVLAGWHPNWKYAWPRDSSWAAVALAGTGHPAMAYQILRFLQRMQAANGTWAARYLPGGSGPVRDGRPAELDADGWVPWAVWSWTLTQQLRPGSRPRRELAQLWPMVTRAADAAARSLTRDGLPGPAMDYWEDPVQVTLGTAAPLLAGLRAAASLATDISGTTAASDGRRWAAAAARLARAITATFGPTGYQRTPATGSGADAAITFLGPPFAAPDPQVLQAASSAQPALTLPDGGLRPGTRWPGTPGVAWTAETAFFALSDAATGQHDRAAALLTWLAAHRTRLGSLPEKVNSSGQPAAVAPLPWTDAVTLLALLAQARHLPDIPAPPRSVIPLGLPLRRRQAGAVRSDGVRRHPGRPACRAAPRPRRSGASGVTGLTKLIGQCLEIYVRPGQAMCSENNNPAAVRPTGVKLPSRTGTRGPSAKARHRKAADPVAGRWWDGATGSVTYWIRVAVVCAICAMTVVVASMRRRREEHLARMTAVAEAAQLALLPPLPPEMTGITIAARYRSSPRGADDQNGPESSPRVSLSRRFSV